MGIILPDPQKGKADGSQSQRATKATITADPSRQPTALAVVPSHIPESLRKSPRWVIWIWVWKGTKWTKVPVNARTGRPAKTNDATTWSDFDSALAAYQRGQAAGVGFVLALQR